VIDVLVAGGGPAGLASALYAARAGLEVRVWEPRGEVIDKACGEGLMPGAVTALADLGVDPVGHRLAGIRYVAGADRAQADFRSGQGRGVRRTALHAALRAAAVDAGVDIVRRPVREVTQSDTAVLVDGTRVRYLIAADGLHSPTRRHLGLDARPVRVRRHGLRAHVFARPWSSYVEVHWSPQAEAYVTPVGVEMVGIALLTGVRGSFEELLRGFPELQDRFGAGGHSRVLGAGPLWQRSRARVAGRVLLVGDAAGYVDALTGEGVALGLAQARAAVASIAAGDPGGYEAAWRRVTWRYRLLTAALLGGTRSRLGRERIVPAAARWPRAFQAVVDTLARPA
jgi:flavin-dependent dehydrogenase